MPRVVLAELSLLHDMIGNRFSEVVASVMAQMSTRSVTTLLIGTNAFTLLNEVHVVGESNADIAPNPKEMQEAYEIRAALEEVGGRAAARVLKGSFG